MRRKRRNHGSAFKAKVALAALRGDKTLAELAEHFELHPTQISSWKQQLLEGAADVFDDGTSGIKDQEKQVKELHAKIGELAMEKDFLSKALGRTR